MNVNTDQVTQLNVDADVRALTEAVLGDHDCFEHITDEHEAVVADDRLWTLFEELGLAKLTSPDDRGGSDAGWASGAALVRAMARSGCRLPVGESDLVADWVLAQVGLPAGAELMAWWVESEAPELDAVHPLVDSFVCARGHGAAYEVAVVGRPIVERRDAAGEWPDSLQWTPLPARVMDEAMLRAALVRSIQVVGAMEAAVEIAIRHAVEREQFGRSVAGFQAVQGHLARVAAETALASAATDAAVLEFASRPSVVVASVRPLVAVARSCAGHAASLVARSTHQVVGAIGTTREHTLHRFTSAMLAWRSDFGDTRFWDLQVIAAAVDRDQLSELDFNLHVQPSHNKEI